MEVETPGGEATEDLDNFPTLAGISSEYIESLPPPVKKRVEALQELQGQHKELEINYFEEKVALEIKYQNLYEPLYKKRYDIVNGVVDVEDAKKQEAADLEEGVPEFWLTAMTNNDTLAMQITERDEDALKFLKDIRYSPFDSDNHESGFKLEFFFSENPYFKNSVLTKIYYMIDENEPILDRVVGTEIDWLPGKNLTRKVLRKKPKKGAKDVKPVTKIEKCQSFFNFFDPPKFPEDDDIDEDAAEEFQNAMEQDFEIGFTIRDKLIPHAVSWFSGEAIDAFDDEKLFENDLD
ncbi:hypothetical protein SUGI_0900210 [Cryptomeria japonica]|nr:hypothetical protein SUGI_0900210 [Cryptomeria japonica]